MKKFWCKLILFAMLLICSAGISSVAYAYDEADIISVNEEYLNAWNSTDFAQYDGDESIDAESSEKFGKWKVMKEQLGAFSQIDNTSVTEKEGEITAVTTATYENNKMTFTLVYDLETVESYGAMYAIKSIDAQNAAASSSKPDMGKAAMNTLMGMGTVFVVLILISGVISLLKFVPDLLEKASGKKKVEEISPAVSPAPVAQPEAIPEDNLKDDAELVAVIMAAIQASMADEASQIPAEGLVVRSIRRRR